MKLCADRGGGEKFNSDGIFWGEEEEKVDPDLFGLNANRDLPSSGVSYAKRQKLKLKREWGRLVRELPMAGLR